MATIKLNLIAEIESDSEADALAKLDAFREAVMPAENYGIAFSRELKSLPSKRASLEHECDNCGECWTENNLHEIDDYFQRVESGGVVPSGQCRECGALCYPFED